MCVRTGGDKIEERVGAANQRGDSMAVPDDRGAALVLCDVVDVDEGLDSAAGDAVADLLRLPASACVGVMMLCNPSMHTYKLHSSASAQCSSARQIRAQLHADCMAA